MMSADGQSTTNKSSFIPVASLSKSHLPKTFRDNTILQLIKQLANLTALIQVQGVSYHRSNAYPCYAFRGDKSVRRSGNGCIVVNGLNDVSEVENNFKNGNADNHSTFFGYFRVRTSTSLVFDETEAYESIVTVYVEDGNGQSRPIQLIPVGIANRNLKLSTIELICITRDSTIAQRFQKVETKRNVLWKTISARHGTNGDTITVCISHPKGKAKSISIGKCVGMSELFSRYHPCGSSMCELHYTSAMSKGSVGAPVWVWSRNGNMFGMATHSTVSASSESDNNDEFTYHGVGTGLVHQYTTSVCESCY